MAGEGSRQFYAVKVLLGIAIEEMGNEFFRYRTVRESMENAST